MQERTELIKPESKNSTAGIEYRALGDAYLRDIIFSNRPKTIEYLGRQIDFSLFGGCFVYWQLKGQDIKNPSENETFSKSCANFFGSDVVVVKEYLSFLEKTVKVDSKGGELKK